MCVLSSIVFYGKSIIISFLCRGLVTINARHVLQIRGHSLGATTILSMAPRRVPSMTSVAPSRAESPTPGIVPGEDEATFLPQFPLS